MDFVGSATPLQEGDIDAEAQKLGVEPAAIWAVCDVESANSGFLSDKRPQILFEAHYFHTLSNGRYDRAYPNISSPIWDRSLYGAAGAHQYDRLAVALGLNRPAALESASWGRFQIMGGNYRACGYTDIESFVLAMMASEAKHLAAFGAFCQDGGLVRFLVAHDWAHFALRYNGSGQVAYYAHKLAEAYKRHLSTNTAPPVSPTPTAPTGPVGLLQKGDHGPAVLALQQDLVKLGFRVTPDGDFGPQTEVAVKQFQTNSNIVADGIVGHVTMNLIGAAVQGQP